MDLDVQNPSEKTNHNLQRDDHEKKFDTLPQEIALDIFSRLPIPSVMQSRFVSKSWQTLSLDQALINLHFSRISDQTPFLIFHCDNPIRNMLWFTELSGSNDFGKGVLRKISIPFSDFMPDFTVIGSCNGLLCLADTQFKDTVCVYNPFNRDYKVLPKSRVYDEEEVVVCGFGYHPETKEYKVVKIVYHLDVTRHYRLTEDSDSKAEGLVLSLGGSDNRWRNIGEMPYYFDRRSMEVVNTNGRLHWLTRSEHNYLYDLNILSFDLADEKFRGIPRPDFNHVADCRTYSLAVLKGCLSAVVVGLHNDLEIWIMKEYDVKESWIKELEIGSYVPQSTFNLQLQRRTRLQKNRQSVRILCILENGKILIEYKGGKLVLHDPDSGTYKHISFRGITNLFHAVVLQGSLNRFD